MTHLLTSKNLVQEIKARQTERVAALLRTRNIIPKLAIILTTDHPAIRAYTRMKKAYGADLGVDVDIHDVNQDNVPSLLDKLNHDDTVHAIIIQLPLERPEQTDYLVDLVAPNKDVDGLGTNPDFSPATPMAILWLLEGHNVKLHGKKVVLVGRGRLVGMPLENQLRMQGIDVEVAHSQTPDLKAVLKPADVIITATGRPGLIQNDMVKPNAVVVDAGVAGEQGKTVGDVAPEVYERDDITISPGRGGVGPLTVCALFENTITAAANS